jgi:hypothetical protein
VGAVIDRASSCYFAISQPVGANFDPLGSFLKVELVTIVLPSLIWAVTVK